MTATATRRRTRTLQIADGVSLPIDYVTKTAAILAQRRKGKTYTGAVIAEQLCEHDLPWVALDPTGAWWGLRSSADGLHAGLPVVVIGGQHGDLPLEHQAGVFIADLVLDHPGYYVIDLSLIESRPAEREFATAFANRLLRRKMQAKMDFPLHLFIDEADMFLPQEKETKGDVALLAAYSGIVRRGGLHGLGATLISQRPALINKNALTQLDLLILLRLIAGNDQDAVLKNYLSRALSKGQAAEVMASLASLKVGEAWFLEPGAEPLLLERAHVYARKTFNSSATPKPGEKRVEPKVFADVELDALREQMGAAIERAKADDPGELRKRIRETEAKLTAALRDIEGRPTHEQIEEWQQEMRRLRAVAETAKVERVEVPVATIEDLDAIWKIVEETKTVGDSLVERLQQVAQPLAAAIMLAVDAAKNPAPAVPAPRVAPPAPEPDRSAAGIMADSQRRERKLAVEPLTDGVVLNRKAERAVLAVLAQFPQGRSISQVAILSGYSSKGGGFRGALSKLRTAGYIEGSSHLKITQAGLAAIDGQWEPLPSGRALLDYWLGQMNRAAERAVLQAAYDAGGGWLSIEEVAERTGYEAAGGGFRGALSKLRTLELIEGKGSQGIRVTETLLG